uniref:Retrovirus-related Pol polyprotein from transposon TNT 1-94 n=1 Tax=Cannabis sativa TaxID=3483 RepID=A0A803P5G5_CANSA
MMAILIYQKLDSAIEDRTEKDEKPEKGSDGVKKEDSEIVMKQARSTLIMNLADNVLRQVIKEKTGLEIWTKLNHLYMAKSTATKIFLKGKFYGFKMNLVNSLEQNLDELNKIVLFLTNMGETIKEEDQNDHLKK